jgi:hypothetical protein
VAAASRSHNPPPQAGRQLRALRPVPPFCPCFPRSKWRWLLPLHTKDEKRHMQEAVLNPRLLTVPTFGGPAQL